MVFKIRKASSPIDTYIGTVNIRTIDDLINISRKYADPKERFAELIIDFGKYDWHDGPEIIIYDTYIE